MAEFLVIRLGHTPGDRVEWILADSDGTRRGAPAAGSLDEAAAAAGDHDVIALVPAASVLTTMVEMPARGGSRVLAALPFALEEQLAEDVETLHFAAGQRRDDGRVAAAVVSLADMDNWVSTLAGAGIAPVRMVAEHQGLAKIPGTMSILVTEEAILFNDGSDIEFALEGVSPGDVLAIAGATGEPPGDEPSVDERPRHLQAYCVPGQEERFAADWTLLRNELASVDVSVLPDGALPRLGVTVAAGRGVNLLQGRFSARSDVRGLLQPWRYAAALLLALGIVVIGGKAADYYQLSRDEAALRAQFTEEYRLIRPDDTREIVDPISVVTSLRRSVGAPAAKQVFLPSLQQLATALQQHRGAEIEAISYRAGIIDVRLSAPDVATLDSIQRIVSNSGRFAASIQSTDQVGDKVSSRIQIRETGA